MIADLLTRELLMEIAGERAFGRGENYFSDGRVISLKEDNHGIAARVRGTHSYRVELWVEDLELCSKCSCPVGQDGAFCKHRVAVGLAWLDRRGQKDGINARQIESGMTDEEIRAHLMGEEKGNLVELLMDHSGWDSTFRDRLVLRAAKGRGKKPAMAAFRSTIDKAIRHRNFVDYERMPEYAGRIEIVVDSLDDLLKRGHVTEVRQLTERAFKQMESAMNEMDDSDGFMGGILDRLHELHLAACLAVKPNPRALAKFLFEWEIASSWEIFQGAAKSYASVLGKSGLAKYRKLAQVRWAKVPPLAPGEKDPERYDGRWRITRVMEALAGQSGEVEELVAVKSRDLSGASSFLGIAETYKAAGSMDAALEWAERGSRAFPVCMDSRLRDFLIEEYQRRGWHDKAIAIAWASFRERSSLNEYQGLHYAALQTKQWPQWREKALALLREHITNKKRQSAENPYGPQMRADHSELVEIYLWERDIEAAWNEAKTGGCDNTLWLRLAEARGEKHPEDAIAIYQDELKHGLQWPQQSAYVRTVDTLLKIRKLMLVIGKQDEFASLTEWIRTQYKPRRNLMKLLDAQGWV